jgi:hypothetical protein
MTNPYAAQGHTDIGTVPVYAVPQQREYAVPDLDEGSPYNDEFGWAPNVGRPSAVDYPSAQRLRSIPRIDFRPDPVRPPEEWYDKRDADEKQRHSVEKIDADGWTELKGVYATDKRWADNPRRTPPPETRPTEQMAPRTYSFFRDNWDRYSARYLNGMHFSMADHRRDYEILGMAPAYSRRNTYRMEPTPWDVDVVDLPPVNGDPRPEARIRSVEVPEPQRSWRL